ncbi:hypothetical protein PIIN_01278 [Serendipita indica DSM 11827]|uniref:Zn(2)-C6 fungal-type domain-containing protein n=1 Tax=Serendipita indica (strain DSM 11827) TaxID=1109443 RepID=G4T7Z5_SERID|nr:hypothetical protein PIIN_01278 [Serendipita indica DSM 11827]
MDPLPNQPLVVNLPSFQIPQEASAQPNAPGEDGPQALRPAQSTALPTNSWSDQPPTQAGNARARVYVACAACRSRKTKCDGLKPEYAPGPPYQEYLPESEKYKLANGICLYDSLPKRRGPDRLPGARVRKKASKIDDSGVERVAAVRRRKTDDVDPTSDPTFESSKPESSKHRSRSNAPTAKDNTPLSLLVDAANRLEATSISGPNDQPTRLTTSSPTRASPEDIPSWLTGSTGLSPPISHQRLSNQPYILLSKSSTSNPTAQHGDDIHHPHNPYRSIPMPIQPHGDITRIVSASDDPNSSVTHRPHTANEYPAASVQAISYEYVPSSGAYIQLIDENDQTTNDEHTLTLTDGLAVSIPPEPSSQFVRRSWFDGLIDFYASFDVPNARPYYSMTTGFLTTDMRNQAQASIVSSVRTMFARSSWWFSLIHVPTFWSNFHHHQLHGESNLQPALVWSLLAISTYLNSSELEGGAWGRERANRLRDEAEASIASSLAIGWVDLQLAQAAWYSDLVRLADVSPLVWRIDGQLLAMYEACPHPYHTLARCREAIMRLDNILRLLKYSSLDADNPMVTRFDSRATPITQRLHGWQDIGIVSNQGTLPGSHSTRPTHHEHTLIPKISHISRPSSSSYPQIVARGQQYTTSTPSRHSCHCHDLALGETEPGVAKLTPMWHYTSKWPNQHDPAEIQKEEARRTVWSFITLASAFGNHAATLGADEVHVNLWSTAAENFALLFPGEATFQAEYDRFQHSQFDMKNTVWALYARAQLLWLACLRMRQTPGPADLIPLPGTQPDELNLYASPAGSPREITAGGSSSADLTAFAMHAWMQTQEIEDALNSHTCNLERAFIFHGREYLSSRYVPFPTSGNHALFNRHQADDWLQHQTEVVRRMLSGLSNITGNSKSALAHRPFFVFWFVVHVLKLLNLWSRDHSMTQALRFSFSFLPAIDYLSRLWPCQSGYNG